MCRDCVDDDTTESLDGGSNSVALYALGIANALPVALRYEKSIQHCTEQRLA